MGLYIDPAVDYIVVVVSEYRKIIFGEDAGPVTGEYNLGVIRRCFVEIGSRKMGTGRFEELHILIAERVDVHILAAEGALSGCHKQS